jgi:hypothetical protein
MAEPPGDEYLTLDQACAEFGLQRAYLRRLLREYGMGEFLRASIRKEVLIRRQDLARVVAAAHAGGRQGRAPRGRAAG